MQKKKTFSKALVNLNFHFQSVLRFVIAVWWKSFQLCGSKRTLCSYKMLKLFSKNRNWQKCTAFKKVLHIAVIY